MPAETRSSSRPRDEHAQSSSRLILCFDGTGNQFQGTPGDTNIVKIYNMLDRGNPTQMHYYQPGIGTYPAEGPVNVGWFRTLMRKFDMVIDAALATSFDSHVIAGYRFIMRYYKPGDRIYVFGFSRGAFTARFLSRMISHVGLLSMGNEEMVPFAYQVYQQYEQNRGTPETRQQHVDFMNSFKKHFCRTEREAAEKANVSMSDNESGIKVHFLGLFDCVSSVGNLDIPFFQKTPPLPAVRGTAEHVRHAVAIDERRVKFKAALFSQEQNEAPEDIKEVWFPGNHGDVGGGWDVAKHEDGTSHKATDDDYFQLSDIALKWMVDEIDEVEQQFIDPVHRFAWDTKEKASFLQRFEKHKPEMETARMHDTMTFSGGSDSKFKVLLWKFMEFIPFLIKRWEFVKDPIEKGAYKWDYIGWPPNLGYRRDIPSTALFHHSVINRMRLAADPKNFRPGLYLPNNPMWVTTRTAKQLTNGGKSEDASGEDNELGIIETNLRVLAEQYAPDEAAVKSRGSLSEKEGTSPSVQFIHDDELTVGSAGKPSGKWDRIYRVSMGH